MQIQLEQDIPKFDSDGLPHISKLAEPSRSRYSGCHGELYYQESTLIWIRGKYQKTITLEGEQILDCCFTAFEFDATLKPALLILTSQTLHFYMLDGSHYTTSLTFVAKQIWAVPKGVIIERIPEGVESLGSVNPILFSIFHPLEEAKPIYIKSATDKSTNDPVCQAQGSLKCLDSTNPKEVILVFHNERNNMLSVYIIECMPASTYDEMDLDYDSQVSTYCYDRGTPVSIRKDRYFRSRFEAVFCWELPATSAVNVFCTAAVVWLGDGSSICGYTCCGNTAAACPLYRYAGVAACPLLATRAEFDLLILSTDGSLNLWIGETNLVPCFLKPVNHKSTKRRRHSTDHEHELNEIVPEICDKKVTGLTQLNGHLVLFKFSKGQDFRAHLDFTVHSKLVNECLMALRYCLPDMLFRKFRQRFLICHFGKDSSTFDEWGSFSITFYSCFHDSTNQDLASTQVADAWQEAMKSRVMGSLVRKLPTVVQRKLEIETPKDDFESFSFLHSQCANLLEFSGDILVSLHLVYEDLGLNVHSQRSAGRLGGLLARFACYLGVQAYADVYHQDNIPSDLSDKAVHSELILEVVKPIPPIRVLKWVNKLVCVQKEITNPLDILDTFGKRDSRKFEGCKTLRNVCDLLVLLYSNKNHCTVDVLSEMSILDVVDIDSWTIGVSLPIREAIFSCRHLAASFPKLRSAYQLIRRYDLEKQLENQYPQTAPPERESGGRDFAQQCPVVVERNQTVKLRFSKDDRIARVAEALKPKVEQVLSMELDAAASTEAIAAAQQLLMNRWAAKSFSIAVGRGMFLFDSVTIVSTQAFEVKSVPTSARLPPLNVLVELAVPAQSGMLEWPEFHTGACAGLQIRQDCTEVDSSWIVFNQLKGADGKPQVEAKHAGFLLGLGLNGHLRRMEISDSLRYYLLPQYEMITVGLLLGLGASFIGKRTAAIAQLISVHIPAMLPPNSTVLNTPSVTKTAAMVAYGLVHFQSHSSSQIDKLLGEFGHAKHSGSDPENAETQSYIAACAFSLALVAMRAAKASVILGRLLTHAIGENTLITTVGATIAIGLVGLKSGNKIVAAALVMPLSEYLLDAVRPEVVLMRTISRNLILWDAVVPSLSWVMSQVPKFILDQLNEWECSPDTFLENDHVLHCYMNQLVGISFVIGLKYAGSHNATAFETLMSIWAKLYKISTPSAQSVARSCLCVLSTCLGMVMAGSGNLRLFELLSQAQKSFGLECTYGDHMALNMAIGLLFLGSGTCTLGTSDLSIAMLVCSLFPIYPCSLTDNRYHNQALRHLWVLSVERRCLITRDVLSGKIECVPVEIVIKNSDMVTKCWTPILLPEWDRISKIRVLGPRYHCLDFDGFPTKKDSPLTIWVQRVTKYLPYMSDPDGRRGILGSIFPNITKDGITNPLQIQRMRERLVHSFSSDPQILSFVHYFCDLESTHGSTEMGRYCIQILHECLVQDKPEMLGTYLWIYQIAHQLFQGISEPRNIANLKIIVDFYKSVSVFSTQQVSVVNREFINLLDDQICTFWTSVETQPFEVDQKNLNLYTHIQQYLNQGYASYSPGPLNQLFSSYLIYNAWPSSYEMRMIRKWHQEADFAAKNSKRNLLLLVRRNFNHIEFETIEKIINLMS